jgi:hypothetical protein
MYKTTPEQKIMILPKLVLALFITVGATAQERLKPGAIYEQGEEIFATVVGFKGINSRRLVWHASPRGRSIFVNSRRQCRRVYVYQCQSHRSFTTNAILE